MQSNPILSFWNEARKEVQLPDGRSEGSSGEDLSSLEPLSFKHPMEP